MTEAVFKLNEETAFADFLNEYPEYEDTKILDDWHNYENTQE